MKGKACKKLPAAIGRRVAAALSSRALRRDREGLGDQINFADACLFWGLNRDASGSGVDRALARLATAIVTATSYLAPDLELVDGHVVTAADLGRVLTLHDGLVQRFASQLDRRRYPWGAAVRYA